MDGNTNDVIANHKGTMVGGVTYMPGVVGQAFNFDGSTGYVQIPTSPALQPLLALSIDAWILPTALPVSPFSAFIINKYDSFDLSAGVSWALVMLATGQIRLEVREETFVYWDADTVESVSVGQEWQHVAATFDATTQAMAVYINGASVPVTISGTGPVNSIYQSSAPVLIGAVNSGFTQGIGNFYAGLVDEAQIFGAVLTPTQVAAIYNAGNSGVCRPAWRGSHRYFKGDEVHDPVKHVQRVVIGGTSGTNKPAWNDAGGTTSDGTITWRDEGLLP